MNEFLASNEWYWRLARTIVQGVLGVVIANHRPDHGLVRAGPEREGPGRGARDGGPFSHHGGTRRRRQGHRHPEGRCQP